MVEGPSPPVPLPPAHLERPNLVNLAAGELLHRVLRLASLRAPDLMKWGLTPATLIGATPTQYRHTARWAKALHDQFAEVDGLVWTSNLCDPDAALMFFGNRVAPSDLMVASVREGADGSFLQDAHNAAKRANILIAL